MARPDSGSTFAPARCIRRYTLVAHLIEDHARDIGYPPRFAAVKLIEGDAALEKKINLPEDDRHVLEHIVDEMEHDLGTDREAATADMRYQYIEGICAKYLKKGGHSRERVRTGKNRFRADA